MYDGKEKGGGKTFFESVEESYYSFCDSLQEKGIKVYDWFVDPLEKNGIPSLPVMLLILLAVLLGAGWLLFNPAQGSGAYSLSVSITTEKGPVDDAFVSLFKGSSLVAKEKTQAGVALFEGIEGGEYSIEVEKEGFEKTAQNVLVPDQDYVEITLKPGVQTRTQPNGKTTPNSVSFNNLDFPSGSGKLVLHIFVNSPGGQSLNAIATVYDKRSMASLGTVNVKDGWGTFDSLEEGMLVYADVSAEGFAPYSGSENAITISKSGINSLTVTLSALTGDFVETLVRVSDLQDAPVAGASIQVFPAGSATPLTLSNSLTDSKGMLKLFLNSKNESRYKLLAGKTGFDDTESEWFKAGEPVAVRLHKPGEYTEDEKSRSSALNALVTQEGTPVKGAVVTIAGEGLVTRTRATDAQGKASFFLFNKRGLNVVASAVKGNRAASKELALDAAEVSVELPLQKASGIVTVKAVRYSNQQHLDALFEARENNALLSSCATNGASQECDLQVPLGTTVQITASSQGFVSETHEVVVNAQQMSYSFALVSENEVQYSQIKDFRVTLEGSNEAVEILYPGKRYEAKFTLLGKTQSTADSFGFYFSVDASKAAIKKVTPPSAPAKTLGSATAACSPTQINYNNANAAWVDLTYPGSNSVSSKSVRVVFEVKPLPEGVLEENTIVKYRSFLVQGGKYYRNPLNANDPPERRFDAKTPLASGCDSPAISRTFVINAAGVSCNNFACVQVAFTQQGAQSARDGFVAKGGDNPAPVIMAFEIAMRTAQLQGELGLSFNAPGGFLGLLSLKYPGIPDEQGTPPEFPTVLEFNGNEGSFSVSVDHLKSYANFEAGFVFGGQVALKPLAKTNHSQLFLQIADSSNGTRHTATYGVVTNETIGGGGVSNERLSLLPGSQDSCGGSPFVIYDPGLRNQILLKQTRDFQTQCGTVEMRTTPLFPADAVKITVDTAERLLVNVTEDDGSSICFESCSFGRDGKVDESSCIRDFSAFTRNGTSVLRYNPEAFAQCRAFQAIANEVKPARVKIELGRIGSQLKTPIVIDVSGISAFEAPSLFIGPIFSPVEGGESAKLAYPQLWAVTNLKQIGSRNVQMYLAQPSDINQPIEPLSLVTFAGPGTQTIALNPNPKSLVLVAKENDEIIFVQGNPAQSRVSGLTEYAQEFSLKTRFSGESTQELQNLLYSNTGFNPVVVKRILEKALAKAKQTAFWRSDGSAWCKDTPVCVNNKFQPFAECCRATREDWLEGSVSFEQTTEPCAFEDGTPAKFCNNLGYPQESGNWNSHQSKCAVPIDFATSAPYCTQPEGFAPSTQVYCDSRCAPREIVVGVDENEEPITEFTMGLEVAYGDSYKESFQSQAKSCSADAAAKQNSMSNVDFQSCKSKGFLCPIFTKIKNSVDTPLCVPASVPDSRGLISIDEDGEGPTWEYASLADGSWKCPAQHVFAVADACFQEACTTYCSTYGLEGLAPRCDESGYCAPDGTRTVPKVIYDEEEVGPLVEVPFSSLAGNETDSPLSFFPSAYDRGFAYRLPLNTLIQPDDVEIEEAFANAGLPLPDSCTAQGNFTYRGLYDLQSLLSKGSQGFFWNHAFSVFSIPNNAYHNVPCALGLGAGQTQTCHLLFIDQRGRNDACIKSITQFDYFEEAPPIAFEKPGFPLSQMSFAGRTGIFKGTRQFAITPTGYVVALRYGSSTRQVFDWWKPEGSYAGAITFTWSKCKFWCQVWKFVKSVIKVAIVVGLIYLAINPGALGPFFSKFGIIKFMKAGGNIAAHYAFTSAAAETLVVTVAAMASSSLAGQGLSIYTPDFSTEGCKTAGVDQGWNEAETQARLLGCKKSSWKVASTTPA
ncbi:MAG: hypothetical protein QXR53_01565 [Candidatus Norongarragalinales archaeon]